MSGGLRRLECQARRHPLAIDVTIAVAAFGLALLAADLFFDELQQSDPTFDRPSVGAVTVAMLCVTLPLAARRRFPLPTVIVVAVAFVAGRQVLDVNEPVVSVLALYFAMYSAARYGRRPWRTPALAVTFAIVMGQAVDELFFDANRDASPLAWFVLVYNAVILLAPWWLGATMRARAQREQELVAQTAELQREREENARRAVFEERVRIARELHDVIAHHVSIWGSRPAPPGGYSSDVPTTPPRRWVPSSRPAARPCSRWTASSGSCDATTKPTPSPRNPASTTLMTWWPT